jgi:hypothetical protein
MPTDNLTQNDGRLAAFPETGKPTGSRLRDAQSFQALFWKELYNDQLAQIQRSAIQYAVNGGLPYKQSEKAKAGAMDGSNLNFNLARARITQTLVPFFDMLDSLKALIAPEIPIDQYDASTRQNAEDVIAAEFTTMMRDWNDFDSRFQLGAQQFVQNGVSLGHFPKDFDWKFDFAGLDNFLIPRNTRNSEEFVEYLIQKEDMIPSTLYRMIENEKAATAVGWNVAAVRKALVRATTYVGRKMGSQWSLEWNKVNEMMKGNDLYGSFVNDTRVLLMHGWVREFDGSFSHYIAERNPGGTKEGDKDAEFLYKKVSRFPPDSNPFTIFCLNIGDGHYHSIRGQGYDQFAYVQTLTKILNDLVNKYRLSMATMFKKTNTVGPTGQIIISNGMCVIPPGVDYVEQNVTDHTRLSIPVLHELQMYLESQSPVNSGMESSPTDPVMTKYQQQSRQNAGSVLNTATINMFNRSWTRLLRESWRRVQEIIKSGRKQFKEVTEFVTRCERRGITKEMILAVERVTAVRAIGAGSQGLQQVIMDTVTQMVGVFDEPGKRKFWHDKLVLLLGQRRANEYMPLTDNPRPVIDQKVALVENGIMFGGGPVPALEGENHAVHAQVHIGGEGSLPPNISTAVQTLEAWRDNGEQGDITELQPQIAFLGLLIPHAEQHVDALSKDPTREQESAAYRKALQEMTASWMTFVRQLHKALDEQAAAAQQQEVPDPELMAKLAKQKAELEMTVQKFQTTQMLTVAESQQRMKIAKEKADTENAIKLGKANADLAAGLASASSSDVVTNRTAKTPNY